MRVVLGGDCPRKQLEELAARLPKRFAVNSEYELQLGLGVEGLPGGSVQINEQLGDAPDLTAFLQVVVGVIKDLSQFHSVLAYQFDEAWNGQVVAELLDWSKTKDLYRGLHFPAVDIPAQARQFNADDLLGLFDFGVLVIGAATKMLGPNEHGQEILIMAEYLRLKQFTTIQVSQGVKTDFEDLASAGLEAIAGMLYVPLSSEGKDFICFLRKGQPRHVHWAGNPNVKLQSDTMLEPRKSFKMWSETVAGRCRVWTDEQLETAGVLALVYGKFIEVWRQKENALQTTRLTNLLLSNASHEVRTPLNHIINYLEMALNGPLDDETRDNLNRSHAASKSLLFTINDLLDLTRLESGSFNEPFDLQYAIEEATHLYRKEAQRRNISFNTELENSPKMVVGDSKNIQTVVQNLTENFLKYTSPAPRIIHRRRAAHLHDGADADRLVRMRRASVVQAARTARTAKSHDLRRERPTSAAVAAATVGSTTTMMNRPPESFGTWESLLHGYQCSYRLNGHAHGLHVFFSVLALCLTVLVATDAEGSITYKVQSPDEAALVQAAADVRYVFRGREREILLLPTPFCTPGTLERWELLNILDFMRLSTIYGYIAQFRFLKRLLLVHGHWSYARNGNMILNFFYKNILTLTTSRSVFEYTYLLWWKAFFTIAPVIAIGLFDRLLDADALMALPELYRRWFGFGVCALHMLDSIFFRCFTPMRVGRVFYVGPSR
ncbi:hypothetical protein C8R45DRAFT_1136801 [Mycena sanguinolenta]|nr:hypothetical protein C8R45DRAFT_1136801 [Mycena sanguinolenta]